MDVAAFVDGIQYFEGQSVHMCHREDTYDIISCMDKRKIIGSKLGITPQAAIGEHDTFGRTGCT